MRSALPVPKALPPIDDITRALHAYVLSQGRVDIPLRKLGERVGVSARMLLHYYGSRDKLMTEVLAFERDLQQEALAALLKSGLGPIELLREYFRMMTEPEAIGRVRFFFDLIAEANRRPADYHDFLANDLVQYWRRSMQQYLDSTGFASSGWDLASLALATARGLYLELFAGSDVADLRRRYDVMLEILAKQLR